MDEDILDNEISRLYSEEDMKSKKMKWALQRAYDFYEDFLMIGLNDSTTKISQLIVNEKINKESVIETLDNMILLFEGVEEYEKCNVCLKIKKELE